MSQEPNEAELAAVVPQKQSPALVIGIAVNTAVILAIAARVLFFTPSPAGPAEGEPGDQHEEPRHAARKGSGVGPTVKLPEFVVHLRNPEAERYARMSFELEIGSEEEKAELAAAMPRVREVFISYLSDCTVEDLRGSEGIDRTKKELMARLEKDVSSAQVRSIYITDIVVQ